MSVYHVCTWCPLRSKECPGPLGTGATNSLTAMWVLALKPFIWERAFVLSHLFSPVFSSLYYQFDALLGGSQLVMTTRKIKLKDFTQHYFGS